MAINEAEAKIVSRIFSMRASGAHMVIISGRGGKWACHGCSQHWNRGTCQNDLTINRQVAEEVLLKELQDFAESKDGLEHLFNEFKALLKTALDEATDGTVQLQERKNQLEAELERLTAAIRQGISAKSLKKAISGGERELVRVEKAIKGAEPFNLDDQIALMRKFAIERIHALPVLFREEPSAAKWELRQRLSEVWMTPVRNAEGDRYFIGVGRWNLIEDDVMSSLCKLLDAAKIQQISGARFLAGVQGIDLCDNKTERLTEHFWDSVERAKSVNREWDTTASGMSSWLENRNATGAWLDCGVRNVAGVSRGPYGYFIFIELQILFQPNLQPTIR